MLRKAGLLCAALAMFSIAGGHWAVLQTVAWTQMLADYARASGSVVTAVEQTFDGEHPCELCQRIAAAKQQETKPEKSLPTGGQTFKAAKTDAVPAPGHHAAALRFPAVSAVCWPPPVHVALASRAERPPVPPPRRLGA